VFWAIIIFVNDLVECYDMYCDMNIFADDAKIYRLIVQPK